MPSVGLEGVGFIGLPKKSKISNARAGILRTPHGRIKTPFFMPDATRGFIKTAGMADMEKAGVGPMVVNTFHFLLQPGVETIKKAGGAHKFMGWNQPLLADSGGFQVFSLIRKARPGKALGKITDDGVIFKSPLDGSRKILTPEKAIEIQFDLGVDMMVCLDDCPSNDTPADELKKSVGRTVAWAARCRREYDRQIKKRKIKYSARPLIFAVIHGGADLKLRKKCFAELEAVGPSFGWDGYGFGAMPIDNKGKFLEKVLKQTASFIPENKLRFALGVGTPADIIKCVSYGWDMFDCVIPTREGRHGKLFFKKKLKFPISNFQFLKNAKKFYETINITNSKFERDFSPINPYSKLEELRRHSKAYLRHLFKLKEPLGARLASLNNLEFYMDFFKEIRKRARG